MRHCTMTYCYETLVRGALAHDTTFKHFRQRRCLTTMRTVQTYECLLIFLTPTQPKFYSKCDSCKKKIPFLNVTSDMRVFLGFLKIQSRNQACFQATSQFLFVFLEQILPVLKTVVFFVFLAVA